MPAKLNERDVQDLGAILTDVRGEREHHFGAWLLRLIKKADRENRQQLAMAYPDHVAAVDLWDRGAHRAMSWEELRRRYEIRPEVLPDEGNFRGGFNVFGPHGILTPEGLWRDQSNCYTVAATGPVADLKARWMATQAAENPKT